MESSILEYPHSKTPQRCTIMVVPRAPKSARGKPRQCSKYAISQWNDCNWCFAHWMQGYRKTHDGHDPPMAWQLLRFTVSPSQEHLSKTDLAALGSAMRRGPDPHGKHEGHGYIYVYTLDSDTRHGDPWFKIGRTTQSVHQRLDGWPGSQLKKSWRVRWNVFAETLIHRFLTHWRAYRFVLAAAKQQPGQARRYLSVWYDSVQLDSHAQAVYNVVPDWVAHGHEHHCYGVDAWLPDAADTVLTRGHVTSLEPTFYPKSKSKQRYTMEQEWFYCDWEYIEDVIQSVVDVINAPYERRHRIAFSL